MGKQRTNKKVTIERLLTQSPKRDGRFTIPERGWDFETGAYHTETGAPAYELPPVPDDLGEGVRAFHIGAGEWRAAKLIRAW